VFQFVIEGKAHGHECSDRDGYPLSGLHFRLNRYSIAPIGATMKNRHLFFSGFAHSSIPRRAAVTMFALVALAWSSLSFCGEIHNAARDGDLVKVQALLKGNPDLVFSRDKNGWTPLFQAADHGQKDVAELLLANHADVNAKGSGGETPLDMALNFGRFVGLVPQDMVELLGQHGGQGVSRPTLPAPIASAQYGRSDTPGVTGEIHNAARDGDLATVRALLRDNPDLVFKKDSDGLTPLHHAAYGGRKDVAEFLLANKAEVNAKNNGGRMPLQEAALYARKDVAELLLANKAEVNAKDPIGRTPLHEAAAGGYKDVVELLLANNADVNAKDRDGRTPLSVAVDGGYNDVAGLLRQHGGHE
jgi:ankyrin repeat protein